jgi:K+-sensing histidine kinase KdpD
MVRQDWEGLLLESVQPGSLLPKYCTAVLAALFSLGLRLLLLEPLQSSTYLVFTPAIVIAGLLGGPGPGLLAMAICLGGAWYLFVPPSGSFSLSQPWAGETMVIFLITGGSLILICQLVRATIRSIAYGDPAARSQLRQLIRRIRLRLEQ